MDKRWRVGLAAVIISLGAGAAAASETHLWVKAGASDATVQADLAACRQQSLSVPVHVPASAETSAGLVGVLIIGAIKKGQAEHTFDRHCMRGQGYVWLPLTPDEQAALAKQKNPAGRAAWIDALYAGDLTARLAATLTPVVPPLPEGAEEPLTFGAVRIDPAALTAASGAVAAGGTALSGKIAHRRTARLLKSLDYARIAKLHVDAGTVFHEMVLPSDFELRQTYWCGPIRLESPIGGVRTIPYCVSTTDQGYLLQFAGGQPWMAERPNLEAGLTWKGPGADFTMAESDADLLGPMDFTLVVRRVTTRAVSLEGRVTRDGKKVTVWAGDLAFADDGKAVLPFWTYRLVLTREGKSVTATYTPDGNGAGWSEAKMAS